MTSLKDYVERMHENQEVIYYITGENKQVVENSPFMEAFKKKNLEVLLMIDPIDEHATQQLKEYDGKKLVNITKEGLDLAKDDDEKKSFEEKKASSDGLCKKMKEILGDKVEEVIVGDAMVESPAQLVTTEFGWSANMQRIMKAQVLRDSQMSSFMVGKKKMQVNPDHTIMIELNKKFVADASDRTVKDLVWLLFETALLTSGFSLDDPVTFAGRIHKLIKLGCPLTLTMTMKTRKKTWQRKTSNSPTSTNLTNPLWKKLINFPKAHEHDTLKGPHIFLQIMKRERNKRTSQIATGLRPWG